MAEDERMFFRERLERGCAPRAAVHADLAIANIVDSFFCFSEYRYALLRAAALMASHRFHHLVEIEAARL